MYGIGYISATLNDVLKPFDGLGKPTIKLEFEDNAALADFLKDSQKASRFSDYQDVTATEPTSTTTKNAKATSKIRNGRLMPADDSRYLPESPAPYSLPPANTPPQLPTSPTSTAKALPPYVEPTTTPTMPEIVKPLDVENNGFSLTDRSGDLPYIDVYFPAQTSINDWFAWADQQYGKNGRLVTLVEIIEPKDGNKKSYKFYFQKKDKMEVLKYLLNPSKYEETFDWIIIRNLADIRRINHGEGSNVHLTIIKPHLVENNQVIEPTTQEVEPTPEPTTTEPEPQPEPTEPEVTAESVTDEDIDTSNVTPVEIDWKAFEDAFAKASNWSSFDPERSARTYVGGYKETYDKYVKEVPAQYRNSFDWFVKRYVADLVSKRSRTASAAVTGPGGIDAKKAASLNRANDRFMEASVQFPYILSNYIHKLQLREKRKAFVNSSIDERYAARIAELKKAVKRLEFLKNSASQIANGGEIPQEIAQSWRYSQRDAKTPAEARARIVAELQYDLNLDKATFKDKLTREVTKGNVEIVDAIIDYLRPLGLYTNRAEIWRFPEWARRKRQTFETATQQAAESAAAENSNYRIEYDTQEDRVKIIFNGMPSAQAREWLKKNGFRWSPRNKAWQRQITDNARRAVEQFKASGLGKPTIKLEFEDNGELMSLFDTDGINGMTVNDKPADIFNCPESQLLTRGYRPTYIRLSDYSHLIDTADGRKTLKGYGFESATLDELVSACRYYPQVAALAAHLKDPNGDPLQTAFNDWHWLHTNIRYDYDTPGEEEIRTPARVWADRYKGVDCDCLAVMTACLLINQGFKPRFEIVAFNGEPTFSHIYVNLDGAAIDRVLPTFLARPDNITKTQIMDIPVYALSGIGGCRDTLSGVYASTLAKIQSGNATADDNNQFRKTQVLVTLRGVNDAAYQLAALLMPYVVTVSDDGTYYFDSTALANLATKLDDDLRQLIADDADPETISQWIATAAQQIDGAASVQSNGGKDTIVVIINPQGNMTRVIGQMVKASTPTLTATTAAATSAAQTPAAATAAETPAIMQTSPAPGISPDGEPATEDKSNAGWWLFGILATAGIAAAASDGKKKTKKRR